MPDNQKNSGNHPGSLSKIRKIFGLNIGTMLFGCLLIYMLFSAVLYLTSTNIESYLVISGPLSRNETYTGLALREESVHQAETSGYVSYYAREGSKINASGAVYGISSTQPSETTSELSAEQLSQIRSNMLSFSKGFNSSRFNSTYSFKYELEGDILQYAQAPGSSTATVSSASSDSSDESADSVPAVSTASYAGQTLSKADTDGIVLYSVDGYEGKSLENLTAEDFDQTAYHETDLKNQGTVNAGDNMYTLVTDERWSLLIPLSGKQAAKLKDRTSVRVKFMKDGMTQSGDFSIVEIDKAKYGKIDFNKGLIRYAADRFLEIELVTNTVTGLKIPLSSIVTKEFYKIPSAYLTVNKDQESGIMIQSTDKNGNTTQKFVKATVYGEDELESTEEEESPGSIYYIDMSNFKEGDVAVDTENQSKYVIREVGVLEGTYCINQGYAVFRQIQILDQNEEYAVISRETRYGLSRYDHIVRNADKVDEQEILY